MRRLRMMTEKKAVVKIFSWAQTVNAAASIRFNATNERTFINLRKVARSADSIKGTVRSIKGYVCASELLTHISKQGRASLNCSEKASRVLPRPCPERRRGSNLPSCS